MVGTYCIQNIYGSNNELYYLILYWAHRECSIDDKHIVILYSYCTCKQYIYKSYNKKNKK